jgi:LysM repeat protein
VVPAGTVVPGALDSPGAGGFGSALPLEIGQNLGSNPFAVGSQNRTVVVTYVTAFGPGGRNSGSLIMPGHTIEVGGTGLSAYTAANLNVNGRDYEVAVISISESKITITVPALAGVTNSSQLRVRLISRQAEIRQGLLEHVFLYSNSQQNATGVGGTGGSLTGGSQTGGGGSGGGGGAAGTLGSQNNGAGNTGGSQTGGGSGGGVGSESYSGGNTGGIGSGSGLTNESTSASFLTQAQLDQQTASLRQQITDLQERISVLNTSLATNSSANTAQYSTTSGELTALRSEISRLNGVIFTLQNGRVVASAQTQTSQPFTSVSFNDIVNAQRGNRMSSISFDEVVRAQQSGGVVAGSQSDSYTVKKGDTLWAIAKKHYGDGKKWRKILEANPQALSKPGNTRSLKVGAQLVIPKL